MSSAEEKIPDKAFTDKANSLCARRRSFLAYLKTLEAISKSRNCVNSDEYSGEICGVPVFIKTFANRVWPVRFFYGAFCIKNEYRTNSEIAKRGLAKVATPYLRPRRDTAIFQYIPNTSQLEEPRHHKDFIIPPKAFFTELIECIRNLHRNGISHGDIRRANILVGKDGHPWLVDTASALVLPERPSLIKRHIFKCMKASDLFSLAKIVFSYYPDWQDDELRAAYERQPLLLKAARYARHYLYALLRHKKRRTLRFK